MLGSVGGGSWISSIESGGGREGWHTHYPDFGYHIHQWVKSKGTLAKDIYLCKIVIPFRTVFFFHSFFFFLAALRRPLDPGQIRYAEHSLKRGAHFGALVGMSGTNIYIYIEIFFAVVVSSFTFFI